MSQVKSHSSPASPAVFNHGLCSRPKERGVAQAGMAGGGPAAEGVTLRKTKNGETRVVPMTQACMPPSWNYGKTVA